jgi:hypothetical protein
VNSSEANYRELFHLIQNEQERPVYWYNVAPVLEAQEAEREWLRSFAARRGDPIPAADEEELWQLYALSRVNDLLLLGFQQGRADGSDWPGPQISLEEYHHFAGSLGLTVFDTHAFTPFYHEVVEVEEAADEDEPIRVVSTVWPCLLLGEMVVSRAGVRVCGGRRFIHKEVAESSTLYWAYRRKNRPYQDLSHGWGSNSQWRTSFRRDYRIGSDFYYHVDGTHDLNVPEPASKDRDGLTREERIELLTHRCFIRTAKPHDDLWPYDDVWFAKA